MADDADRVDPRSAIVTVTEAVSNRALGLRMPYLIGAAVHVGLYLYASPVLNTTNIEAAKAEGAARESEPSEQ